MAKKTGQKKAVTISAVKRDAVIASLKAGNTQTVTAVTVGICRGSVRAIQKKVFNTYVHEKNPSRLIQRALKRRAAERAEQLRSLVVSGGHGRASEALALVQETNGCLWPIGSPQEPDFRFCGAQRLPHKPYCAKCNKRAYLRSS